MLAERAQQIMCLEEKFIQELLEFLCKNPRKSGSEWNEIVQKELISQFEKMGYNVHTEESDFIGWELLEEPSAEYIKPFKKKFIYKCLPVVWSGSTDGKITGTIKPESMTIKTFESYQWNLFHVVDEDGSLLACLISNEKVWPQPIDNNKDQIPYIMISTEDMRFIQKCIMNKDIVKVRLSIKTNYLYNQKFKNIIAKKSKKSSLIIGAHYDSFFNTVGAHDNASGTAAVLNIAHRLSLKTKSDVQFVLFDAEEWNKLGSYYYVENLENLNQIDNIKLMINIDSIGYGELIFLSVHSDIKNTIIRTLKTKPIYYQINPDVFILLHPDKNESENRLIVIQSNNYLSEFDTWPFIKKGIPVINITTSGKKSYPFFHHPDDNLSQISGKGYGIISDVVTLVESLLI